MPIAEYRIGNQAAPYANRREIVGMPGIVGMEAWMPSIEPYGRNRVVGLVRIRYVTGQDELPVRCMAQQKVSRPRIMRPIVVAFGKDVVAEPLQPNERACALGFSQFGK